MTITVLRCRHCGAEWVSNMSAEAIAERAGGCLRCDGPLSEVAADGDSGGDGSGPPGRGPDPLHDHRPPHGPGDG